MINAKDVIQKDQPHIIALCSHSQRIETLKGPIEINYKNPKKEPLAAPDEKPTVLFLHGALGGHDQSMLLFDQFFGYGFNILTLSRPGYCKTPLRSGKTYEAQADLIAALLDKLKISQLIVVGLSAAGPTLYHLAIRHPHKIKALVAISCISRKDERHQSIPTLAKFLLSRPMVYLIGKIIAYYPGFATRHFLKANSSLPQQVINTLTQQILHDPEKFKYIYRFYVLIRAFKTLRKAGVENDIEQAKKLHEINFSDIECPALISHGNADSVVLFEDGLLAASKIKQAEHFWIAGGSHFAFWLSTDAEGAHKKVVDFIEHHL